MILITGGAGFIGTHLARAFSKDQDVVSLDIAEPKDRVANVRYVQGNVRDLEQVRVLVESASAVVHLAAMVSVPLCEKQPQESHRTNVGGVENVLSACQEFSKPLIFSGSCAVYGAVEGRRPIDENFPIQPMSEYARQKWISDQLIFSSSVPAAVFRFFNVYGLGQDPSSPYSGVISIFDKLLREGKDLELHDGGQQVRDFIHVSDVVAAIRKVIDEGRYFQGALNLGSGIGTSIKDLAEVMVQMSGSQSGVRSTPARKGDIPYSCCNPERVQAALDWRPRVSLKQGIQEVVVS